MSYIKPGSVNALPKDAQFEQATKFELVINVKTAKQLGLQSVLFWADKVIK